MKYSAILATLVGRSLTSDEESAIMRSAQSARDRNVVLEGYYVGGVQGVDPYLFEAAVNWRAAHALELSRSAYEDVVALGATSEDVRALAKAHDLVWAQRKAFRDREGKAIKMAQIRQFIARLAEVLLRVTDAAQALVQAATAIGLRQQAPITLAA